MMELRLENHSPKCELYAKELLKGVIHGDINIESLSSTFMLISQYVLRNTPTLIIIDPVILFLGL